MKQRFTWIALLSVLMFRLGSASASDWELVAPIVATDVAAGGQQVYFIGDYVSPDVGGPIYRLQNGRISYLGLFGKAITACSDGLPWAVAANGDVYMGRSINGDWEHITGVEATDIGCGDPGQVYVIGSTPWPGNKPIFRWEGDFNDWYNIGGVAVRIDVDRLNRPWVVNDYGDVFRGLGEIGTWVRLNKHWDYSGLRYDYQAIDIGVDNHATGGAMGTSLNHAGKPYYFSENYAWSKLAFAKYDYFRRIDADEDVVYAIFFDGYIYKSSF